MSESTPSHHEADTEPVEGEGTGVSDPATPVSGRLRGKPVLAWTKEDWQLWIDGRAPPEASSVPSAETERTKPDQGGGEDALEPSPDQPLASAPPTQSTRDPAPADLPAAAVRDPAPADLPAAAVRDPAPADVVAPSRPPSEEDRPPSSPGRAMTDRAALASPRPPVSRPAPPPRVVKPAAPARPAASRARATFRLMVVSVVVGAVLAGFVTMTLVLAALALRRAVG